MHPLLEPPRFDDPVTTERAALAWVTLWMGLGVCLLQAMVYLFTPTMQTSALVLVPEVAAFALALWAVRRGWVRVPSLVVLIGLTALVTGFVFFGGGLSMGLPPVLGVLAVLGALLAGARMGAALTLWAASCTVAVYLVGSTETLLIDGQDRDAIRFTTQLITVCMGGAMVTYAVHRLSVALGEQQAQRSAAEDAFQQLARTRQYAQEIVRSMADAVILCDDDGTVLQANDAAVALLGAATDQQLVFQPIDTLIDPASLEQLDHLATPGRTAICEATISDGTKLTPVRMARSAILGPDDEELFVYVLTDISHRVEAQRRSEQAAAEAEAANRAKSQFLANMSHELRTPLNAVIGYADILLDDIEDDEQLGDLQRIRQAGQHLLSLINDVLDMSKIEAGRMEVHLESVDLADLVQEVEMSVVPAARNRGNHLRLIVPDEPVRLYTDARKVRQILLNLASNAVKFTEAGQVVIRLTADTEQACIAVEDTGIGIAPEALDRLFQPFVQVDSSTSRRYGGTGLGLALSRRFAEMLGGAIGATSTPGQGSTFQLSLPMRSGPSDTPAPAVDQGHAPLVLCVDDDVPTLDLLARVLRREGLRVARAATAADALALARAHRPAVITLDVMMPEMDGWDMLTRLRADPDLRDLPVVMVSMVDHDRAGALALGASDYLTKPVDGPTLVTTLSRYLRDDHGEVLVVDDDAQIRDLLSRALSAEGWEVHTAEHSGQALTMLDEGLRPDVVTLDLMMPELDGFAFVDRVRDDDRFRDLPIVVLTAMELSKEQWADLVERTAEVVPKGVGGMHQVLEAIRRFSRPPSPRA